MIRLVGGPIPCAGCHKNIVTGIVYKIGDEEFICEDCYENAIEMFTEENNNLKQFKENTY